MTLPKWTEVQEVQRLLEQKGTVFILKHSTRCPISAAAYREFEGFAKENAEVPARLVLVVENRPVSRLIAEELEVEHASPQAILIRDGGVEWHASHWNISRKALESAWSGSNGREDE